MDKLSTFENSCDIVFVREIGSLYLMLIKKAITKKPPDTQLAND